MVKSRTVSMAIATAVVIALGSPANAQSNMYTVSTINPLPGQDLVLPEAINNRGQVVGASVGPSGAVRNPFLFTPGAGTQPLPLPAGYGYSVPTDINDDGVIVGICQTSFSDLEHPRAWKFENGQLTLYAPDSFAHSINNFGAVVARSCWTSAFTPYFACYFLDNPGNPIPDLTFGATNSYPGSMWRFAEINDVGEIACTAVPSTPSQFRLADGTLVDITPPAPPFVRTYTWGVNNAGQVIARWEYNVGSQYFSKAFIWNRTTGAQEIGIVRAHVRPKGINNFGHVVGESGNNQNSYLDVWRWTPQRGSEDLRLLIDPAAGIVLNYIYGINDAGQIIARGAYLQGGANVTCVLSPVVLPGDIDGDGDVDAADQALFVEVLLGADTHLAHVSASDLNHDGAADGADVQAFVDAISH